MNRERTSALAEEEAVMQTVVQQMIEEGTEIEDLTFEELKNLINSTGLTQLPQDNTRTHFTRELYFKTRDGLICHLIFTPHYGYELDTLAQQSDSKSDLTDGESENLAQLKRMSDIIKMSITAVLERTLEKLVD